MERFVAGEGVVPYHTVVFASSSVVQVISAWLNVGADAGDRI